MDPNAALEQLRETAKWLASGNADGSDLERAVWLFADLDEWLTMGGFPPKDWDRMAQMVEWVMD